MGGFSVERYDSFAFWGDSMRFRRLVLFAVLFAVTPARAAYRFAFGGCNFQRFPQTHWKTIAADQPKLWVWNGDIIYADGSTMETRRKEYEHLKNNKFYAAFRTAIPVVGVWDDHDFNSNNSSGNFKDKKESQRAVLDFLDEPSGSDRRRQEGIYTSYRIAEREGKVRLVLLDERYFRDDPGPEADVLGEGQWAWLETELGKAKDAGDDAIFIVSSSQVLAEDTGADRWAEYPKAKKRLFDLLAPVDVPVVFLSGDRHHAEMSKDEIGGKTYYDATSSGLTHRAFGATPNPRRVGPLYVGMNYGLVDLERVDGKLTGTVDLKKIDGTSVQRVRVF